MNRIYITDCEGPISKNDNAYELAEKLIPEGATLFTIISRYDDIQVEIVKRPGYKPGDTLKLIIPFLKAYGATDEVIRRLSAEGILLVPGAAETLRELSKLMPSYIVSTSYQHYIESLCEIIGFPKDNSYSTRLELDRFKISNSEAMKIREWANILVKRAPPKIPRGASSLEDLDDQDKETIKFLDKIFWSDMRKMNAWKIFSHVNPVGGAEKVEAIKDIIRKNNSEAANIIYFGDSITDSAPLKYVRENGGVAVSFNGNEYAVREAEFAVISDNTLVATILATTFSKGGRNAVERLISKWNFESIEEFAGTNLRVKAETIYRLGLPQIEIITNNNIEKVTEKSCQFRIKVRGEAVGRLG
ncbi:MAG: hypothetical protein QXL25_00075 [Candidatus Bathyarchaeia archaeon]|nr:hypothetical protein [Candidatus Bathyarchaeota archaeon]